MALPDIPCLTNPRHKYNRHCFEPSDKKPLPLYIPPCVAEFSHGHHPLLGQPLRIQIEGPLVALQKILPLISWDTPSNFPKFPLPGGPELAKLTFRALYGRDMLPDIAGDMVVRDEYTGWLAEARPKVMIDYYGVTFDHNVPPRETNPDVFQLNVVEVDDDQGEYANKYNLFPIDPKDYFEKKVLAVPRCCQKRKGTTDRERINNAVNARDATCQEG